MPFNESKLLFCKRMRAFHCHDHCIIGDCACCTVCAYCARLLVVCADPRRQPAAPDFSIRGSRMQLPDQSVRPGLTRTDPDRPGLTRTDPDRPGPGGPGTVLGGPATRTRSVRGTGPTWSGDRTCWSGHPDQHRTLNRFLAKMVATGPLPVRSRTTWSG